jgi:Mg2+ and Co2+ transporter CorA
MTSPKHPHLWETDIIASSGLRRVTVRTANQSEAQTILNNWESVVSLNQEIRYGDSEESLKIFRDLACTFGAQVIRDFDGRAGAQKSVVSRQIIHTESSAGVPNSSPKSISWTHIERPNQGTIEWAAKQAGLEPSKLEHYLGNSSPCAQLLSPQCLVIRTFELETPTEKFGLLSAKLCTIICGENFLITMAPEKLSGVENVWSSLENKLIGPQHSCSSSLIAQHIIEATLGHYQQGVEQFSTLVGDFWKTQSALPPDDADLRIPQAMREDLRTAEGYLLGFDDAQRALERREEALGQSPHRTCYDSLGRTEEEIKRSLSRADRDIRDGETSWASLRDQWRNDILFRLAFISALAVPVSVWSGICGMNFAQPMSDFTQATGLGVSFAISAILIGGLLAGKRGLFGFMSGYRAQA